MKTIAKVAIVSSIVLVVGALICAGGIIIGGKDISNYSTADYSTRTVDIDEDFNNIDIDVTSDDIYIYLSDNDSCTVELTEREGTSHEVGVEGDTLVITSDDGLENSINIGFNMQSPNIKIYLPASEYEKLNINSTSGDIGISDLTFDETSIATLTGDILIRSVAVNGTLEMTGGSSDIDLNDVTCENLVYDGTTGDVQLTDVIVAEDINIDVTTGDVTFDEIDALNIYVHTSTGDIEGSVLTDKTFDADVVTGDVSVPRSSEGGICELSAITGDIDVYVVD